MEQSRLIEGLWPLLARHAEHPITDRPVRRDSTSCKTALNVLSFDVWLLNWRVSIEIPPSPWTRDQAAVYDHPEAVKTVIKETEWDEAKAVIHCQGSTSFMVSAMAELTPQVKTIVTQRGVAAHGRSAMVGIQALHSARLCTA